MGPDLPLLIDPTRRHQPFDVAETELEAEIQPRRLTSDLGREAVSLVRALSAQIHWALIPAG